MRDLPFDKNELPIAPPDVTLRLNQRQCSSGAEPLVTLTRRYRLITPLFGGGVDPGVADPVTVIRGTAIRGHLRFWWRACRGGQFDGDLVRMKSGEDKCWGAASTVSSPVQIAVDIESSGNEEHVFQIPPKKTRAIPVEGWNSLAYAAFPLQDSLGKVRSEVKFTLTLTFPVNFQKDVEAALWAWETFGGIGARTRRGFGALMNLEATLPSASEEAVRKYIISGLEKHCLAGTWPNDVPHLSQEMTFKVSKNPSSTEGAWEGLIRKLKDLRQNRNPGSMPKRPGRSRWPEPDEIRRLTGQRASRHAMPLSTISKFPRAAFGLPVVFHFKDEDVGDPRDTILQGQKYDRLASPLILRPLSCANGQAIGVAILLAGTAMPPGGLKLNGAPNNPAVEHELTQEETNTISVLKGNKDVLTAFLNTL